MFEKNGKYGFDNKQNQPQETKGKRNTYGSNLKLRQKNENCTHSSKNHWCTFFGKISAEMRNGICDKPIPLLKLMHAAQKAGIQSSSGRCIHSEQYVPNSKKKTADANVDPM